MLKKLLAAFLVLALLFSLTACSDSEKDGSSASDDAATSKNAAVSGLWKANQKIKVADIMTAANIEDIPGESSALFEVFLQTESAAEIEAFIQFNEDNSYELKYKLDSFKAALKEYYHAVYSLYKEDRSLFELVTNMDFVVIETMLINSTFTSYYQIVDHYEQMTANSIDGINDTDMLLYLAPAMQGYDVKGGFVIRKGYGYELDDKNLTVKLDKEGKISANLTVNEQKIEFSSVSGEIDDINSFVFKNGLEKTK